MKRLAWPFTVLGGILLLSSMLHPDAIDARTAWQASVTPTFASYLPLAADYRSPPATPTSTPVQGTTLYLLSNGLLDPQPAAGAGYAVWRCYSPCVTAERWTASLAGALVGSQFSITGAFRFTTAGAYTVPIRIILAHQGAEEILVEYPLYLTGGTQTFYGFSAVVPNPVATPGDTLIFEIDRRGITGSLTWYFGGAAGARLDTPALALPGGARFTGQVLDSTFASVLPLAIAAADLNGDGAVDLVGGSDTSSTGAGTLAWWENDGHQHFSRQVIDANFYATSIAAADIDGDGVDDILACGSFQLEPHFVQSQVAWWQNDGRGHFTKHLIDDRIGSPDAVVGVDLDRDGDMDVVGDHQALAWWENIGGATFSRHALDSLNPAALQVVDMDRDGILDILGVTKSGKIAWWQNNGSQVFTRHLVRDVAVTLTGDPNGIAASDISRDGNLDIVSALSVYDEIAWWENNGSQSFTQHLIHSTFANPSSIHAADVDGDGDIDLLGGGGAVAWWENIGGQAYLRHVLSRGNSHATLAVDLDRNGDVDLVVADSGLGSLAWWENIDP